MTTVQLRTLHIQILDIYRKDLIPIITKYFNQENTAFKKVDGNNHITLVTQADLAINALLTETLSRLVPKSKVISEESNEMSIGEFTFIIDPIDGTHSFARNFDDWGISIVLYHGATAIYGIVFYPNARTQYYYAIKNIGAFDANDNKIMPIKFFDFKPLFICAPSARKTGRLLIDLTKERQLSFRAFGSATYTGYTLFGGGTDLVLFDHLSAWDVLGCIFIAEQIGLKVKWIGQEPLIKKGVNLAATMCTAVIFKPDFDQSLLNEMLVIINNTFGQ